MIDDNFVIEPEDQFGPPGEAYREIIREQKKIIADLCDALEFWPYWGKGRLRILRPGIATQDPRLLALIERAREATKHE